MRYQAPKKDRGSPSKHFLATNGRELSRREKGAIAEAAVLFRLAVHGFHVFSSVYDGDRTDWLVEKPATRQIIRLQVKWAGEKSQYGLPAVPLVHYYDRQRLRYQGGDFDFIVGYEFYTDTAYVWSEAEVAHRKACVVICPESAERWDKLRSTPL